MEDYKKFLKKNTVFDPPGIMDGIVSFINPLLGQMPELSMVRDILVFAWKWA